MLDSIPRLPRLKSRHFRKVFRRLDRLPSSFLFTTIPRLTHNRSNFLATSGSVGTYVSETPTFLTSCVHTDSSHLHRSSSS